MLTGSTPEEQPDCNTPYPRVKILADKPGLTHPISPYTVPIILEAFKDELDIEALTKIIHSLLRTLEI